MNITKAFVLSDGTVLSLELGGIAEICIVASAYYITKKLLEKD
jgi:hypothetical protein